jgi:tRNA(adenine34) deaminase
MAEAIALANQAASENEVPVGAVVVHGQKIVGRGYNRRESDQDPLSHAELKAIAEAALTLRSWRLAGCTLVVTLEPCPMCLAACQQARVDQVVFGASDPKGGALSLGYRLHEDSRTNHRFPVTLLETETCKTVLQTFFRQQRQKP